MKRLVALLAATLTVAALVAAPSATGAPSHKAPHYKRFTFNQILGAMPGDNIGPNVKTGYGKMHFTHWHVCGKRCPGHPHRLRMMRRISNHQPTAPAARDFCWPWDYKNIWFGQGCWNAPGTWDWPRIWDDWGVHPSVINNIPGMNTRIMQECRSGTRTGTYAIAGTKTADFILGLGAKLTPEGWASLALGGCIINLYHRYPGIPE